MKEDTELSSSLSTKKTVFNLDGRKGETLWSWIGRSIKNVITQ